MENIRDLVDEFCDHLDEKMNGKDYKLSRMIGVLQANLSIILSQLQIYHPDALEKVLSRCDIGEFYITRKIDDERI